MAWADVLCPLTPTPDPLAPFTPTGGLASYYSTPMGNGVTYRHVPHAAAASDANGDHADRIQSRIEGHSPRNGRGRHVKVSDKCLGPFCHSAAKLIAMVHKPAIAVLGCAQTVSNTTHNSLGSLAAIQPCGNEPRHRRQDNDRKTVKCGVVKRKRI
jgi:hypothetical protein